MTLTIHEAFESVQDSLDSIQRLYRLQALSQHAHTVESQSLLQVAVEHCNMSFIGQSISQEGFGSMIKAAWEKIIQALRYIWNMIKALFSANDDEREVKKLKMRQDEVRDILKTAGHNVKFDDVAYMDDSFNHYFAYFKLNVIELEFIIERLLAVEPVLHYIALISKSISQGIDIIDKELLRSVESGNTNGLWFTSDLLIREAISTMDYYAPVHADVLKKIGIEPRTFDPGASGYLSCMLGNQQLYITHQFLDKESNGFYQLKKAEDPKLHENPVKIKYFKPDSLGDFSASLGNMDAVFKQIKEAIKNDVAVSEKQTEHLIKQLRILADSHVDQTDALLRIGKQVIDKAAQLIHQVNIIRVHLETDYRVYKAILEANIKHYKP